MANLKLSVKIGSGFMIAAFITLIVGVIGWRGVVQTDEALKEVAQVRLPSVLGLEIINEAQTAIQRAERCLLIPEFFQDKKEVELQLKNLADAWERVDKGRKIYDPLPQTNEEEGIWKKFTPAWETWKKDQQQVIELIKQGKRDEAMAMSRGKARQSFQESEKLLEDLVNLNIRVADEVAKPALAQADRTRTITLGAMVTGVLIALGAGFYLSRSITRPIQRIITALQDGAEQVASASGQVSAASQQLAQGSSEQAASLEETSSSLEEMSSMTRQNADNANQANTLMTETQGVVERANTSMSALTASMREITAASDETAKIVKTIDEIAFQTNLLALNAAVEAARAGEAGAGFAVVADEVRNLAMRAADAAKNTADLIETTVHRVKGGSELVEKTAENFGQVALSTVKVKELVAEIAAASHEQAQGVGQINKAVGEMDKVVQQNAANAEESASASEELSAQAEQMKVAVEGLVVLVGGGTSKKADRPRALEPARQVRKKAMPGTLPVPVSKSTLTQAAVRKPGAAKVVTPEQVIPFDDDDFKNF